MKKSSFSSPSALPRRARGLALAALAAALSLLALCALYAPLVRSHGPAASADQLAQIAGRGDFHLFPINCVM